MTVKVTLELPNKTFRQIENIAATTQREVSDILAELVIKAVPTIHAHPQREAMLGEEAAFEQQRAALWQQYANQFVALHQAEVVDHDTDEDALIARIESAYPGKIVLIRQVLNKLEPPLVFRSPRLIHENDR
jgi:hypothetical protein